MPWQLVGTRSCAIRHRTSEKDEHLVRLMGKSLSFDSARARSEKQQEEVSRRAAPDARERILERIPTGAGGAARSYYFYGAYQRFNSNQKQRPSRQSFFRTLLGQE